MQGKGPTIQKELLAWYDQNKRDLPWRKNKDPYRIWVSEIMLQQTRVSTVIPYYERFMERFPTLYHLSEASDDEVVKYWEGLGYYSRIRNLHSAVKEVATEYKGVVPADRDRISQLKGVGSYTSGAILSIAYDMKVPAVDGNVMRVFSRLYAITDEIQRQPTKRKMEAIAEDLIPEDRPGDFNQALMELGAMVCTPTSPQCLFCPLQTVCDGYAQGMEQELPRKKRAKAAKKMEMVFALIQWKQQILLEKRPEKGLLAGMWALPTWECKGKQGLPQLPKDWKAKPWQPLGEYTHVFSHQHWSIDLYEVQLQEKPETLPEQWYWFEKDKVSEKAFPNVYRKAFPLIF